jgi:hypothetical protein
MSVSEHQAKKAIVVLERVVVGAQNGNQASEDLAVIMAAGPDLYRALLKAVDMLPRQYAGLLDPRGSEDRNSVLDQTRKQCFEALAKARGETT